MRVRNFLKTRGSFGYCPHVEALEPKRCLSASLQHAPVVAHVTAAVVAHVTTPTASITQVGNTLRITDPTGGDTITVADDGTGDISAGITNTSTSASVVTTASFTGITRVIVNSTGGDETLDYTLTGALTQSERIQATLTKGGNIVDVEATDGLSSSSLFLDVSASGGANNVTENFGALTSSKLFDTTNVSGGGNTVTENLTDADDTAAGTELSSSTAFIGINGSGGDNTLDSTVTGGLSTATDSTTTSTLLFDIEGSGGLNTVGATVDGDIGAGSLVGGSVSAGGNGFCGFGKSSSVGGDTVSLTYDGKVLGILAVGVSGSGNAETLDTSITVEAGSGSTGKVFAVERVSHHGSTPDTLVFNVTDDTAIGGTTGLAKLSAKIIDYLANSDSITNSSNVTIDSTLPWCF
jgi:hypothetical protein